MAEELEDQWRVGVDRWYLGHGVWMDSFCGDLVME